MDREFERCDRDRKQRLVRFLLIVAVVVSSLISVITFVLTIGEWIAPPSDSVSEFIKKTLLFSQPKERFTFVAWFMFSSILATIYSLVSPKRVAGILEVIAYMAHLAYRIVNKCLLLVMQSTVLFLSLILLTVGILLYKVVDKALSEIANMILAEPSFVEPGPFLIVTILLVVFATELFPRVRDRVLKDIWNSISRAKEKIKKNVQGGWFPKPEVKKSVSETRCEYSSKIKPTWEKVRNAYTNLILACAIFFSVGVAYSEVVKYAIKGKDWIFFDFSQTRVYIFDLPDSTRISRSDSTGEKPNHLHPEIEKRFADHPHPEIEKRFANHPHTLIGSHIPDSYETGDRLTFVYREGRPDTKDGINPRGGNLTRLRKFKKEISKGPADKDVQLRIRVQGFASVAPVNINGDLNIELSESYNCEIANQRAEALIFWLVLPDSVFGDKGPGAIDTLFVNALNNHRLWGRKNGDPCRRDNTPDSTAWKERGFQGTILELADTTRIWKTRNYHVLYKPWPDYKAMAKAKPADDGSVDDWRQPDLEFLNRTAQISIEEVNGQGIETPATPAEKNTKDWAKP